LTPGSRWDVVRAMALQRLVRFLLPREEHFYDFLERQASVAHDGVKALARLEQGNSEAVCAEVQALEHAGDELVRAMEDALAKTFVTPIDREDLQKLCSELDDILDYTNIAARAVVLFGLDRATDTMLAQIQVLMRCTETLERSMPKLRAHSYGELIEASRRAKAGEGGGRHLSRRDQHAVSRPVGVCEGDPSREGGAR
jgi:predicted phosphate transport protein (TIGR00153 family)